jgi:hypothetical protein
MNSAEIKGIFIGWKCRPGEAIVGIAWVRGRKMVMTTPVGLM